MHQPHAIPLFTLVEILGNPEYPRINDGLRLYVQFHEYDCDGTPLYALTSNFKTIGRHLQSRLGMTDEDRAYYLRHGRAVMHGYSEKSLVVIHSAEITLAGLAEEGYGFDGKSVEWIERDQPDM